MISKTLSTSVCYARLFDECPDLAEFAQSLYPLLVTHADDFGREQGDILTIKYRIHPRSPRPEADFARAMQALTDVGLIQWYDVKGRQCYQVAKFDEHQSGLHKRTRSQFPAVPGNSGKVPEVPAQLKGRELNRTERKRREQNGTEIGDRDIPNAVPHADSTRAREETAISPVWRKPDHPIPNTIGPLIDGAAQRRHGNHAWCADRDGLCVPFFLHMEFIGKSQRTDAELKCWYAATLLDHAGQPIGEDSLVFWRNSFAQWIGSATRTSGQTKADRAIAGAQRVIAAIDRGEV